MSSILTNNSAMVALQTLKSVNKNLSMTQSEISTGKSVANAKDNSAVWAISKVMDSDVQGFKSISDSLNLGQSTVTVARNASETVTDLLTQMKGKIVAAQEENVNRDAIQKDIDALTDQIGAVVGAAQFNGLNLINGNSTDAMNVLSSLDRDASGNVSASHIEVERHDLSLSTTGATLAMGTGGAQPDANALISSGSITNTRFGGAAFDATNAGNTATVSDGGAITIAIGQVEAGASYEINIADVDVNVVGGGTAAGTRTFQYVASATDGTEDVARNLVNQINSFFSAATDSAAEYSVAQGTTNTNEITITNGAVGGVTNPDIIVGLSGGTGGTPGATASSSGLGAVQNIDVTTDSGATGALAAIDGFIELAVDAAASFGSDQGRIETQTEFVSKLSDSLKSGIGSLVDANMEETSARLQALQVQQQLATQSLSIANQAPQSILSLFR